MTIRLTLYIAGNTPYADQAIANLRRLCETDVCEEVHLEIVDVIEHPDRARDQKILAIPTLIRELPKPMRRLIGDLSRTSKVLFELDLQIADPPGGRG